MQSSKAVLVTCADLLWLEGIQIIQSCNFTQGILLNCGGSSALPCHLLVCVWLSACIDVCVLQSQ